MGTLRAKNINATILRQCREQIGLNIDEAQKKLGMPKIGEYESGEDTPTFKQIEKLSHVYRVPQWVFLRNKLPSEYNFINILSNFRQFGHSNHSFDDYKTRVLIAETKKLRELILEFRDDMEMPVEPFSPPDINESISKLAGSIRKWLNLKKNTKYEFKELRRLFENRGMFIFMTSKYASWSKVEPALLRGFCVYKDTLPIIVINDSDAYKAQSFTLFHELGHLIRKESSVDDTSYLQREEEGWCDKLSAEILMPTDWFIEYINNVKITGETALDIINIDKIAKHFAVSSLACLVKLNQLGKIKSSQYNEIKDHLYKRYEQVKEKQKNEKSGVSRNIAREKLNQYGDMYTKTVMQAFHNQEIGLHKLCKLLEIKKIPDIAKLESML